MNNTVAKITRYFSYAVLVLGFIGGIVIGNTLPAFDRYGDEVFNTFAMFVSWVSTLFAFFLFYVLSEIVELLQNQLDRINNRKTKSDTNDVFDEYLIQSTNDENSTTLNKQKFSNTFTEDDEKNLKVGLTLLLFVIGFFCVCAALSAL